MKGGGWGGRGVGLGVSVGLAVAVVAEEGQLPWAEGEVGDILLLRGVSCVRMKGSKCIR